MNKPEEMVKLIDAVMFDENATENETRLATALKILAQITAENNEKQSKFNVRVVTVFDDLSKIGKDD